MLDEDHRRSGLLLKLCILLVTLLSKCETRPVLQVSSGRKMLAGLHSVSTRSDLPWVKAFERHTYGLARFLHSAIPSSLCHT